MEREELLKELRNALDSVDITFPFRYVFVEAIEALQQPSLPEGLDEAAEEYARPCGFAVGIIKEETTLPPNPDKLYAFKAGAKWMAGQGVTCGGRIMKSSTGETYAESDYVPLDGKCGEKVKVIVIPEEK